MIKLNQTTLRWLAVLSICAVGIFTPDLPSASQGRALAGVDEKAAAVTEKEESETRWLAENSCTATTPGSKIESYEDFENSDLSGWVLGGQWDSKIDNTYPDKFTAFLGRFGEGQTATKTYLMSPETGDVHVSFWFYEIDSWDGNSTVFGNDRMFVIVNGVELDLGEFKFNVDEGTRTGSKSGIFWKTKSSGTPLEMGFNKNWMGDQKHFVTIDIPRQHIPASILTLTFRTSTNEALSNESAGIDNLEIVGCQRPATSSPSSSPVDPFTAGVNGDPLIMGLSGQLFFFDGRNGAWYSAVSTPSFQWNLKIQNYETCPAHSNTFVSGAGFTFFKNGKKTKAIEINVVNAYNTDVGCGNSGIECLGAGSLELLIDGVKHTTGGYYKSKDGSATVTAFNTFYQCSRKWYDFEVQPTEDKSISLRNGRKLETINPNVFDVIDGIRGTMIDEQECAKWISDRKKYGDLFQQPGHYSTIIIQTDDVTLHLEYKQESERCNAHSIDVWISSVSSALVNEKWEGVIGETKDISYVPNGEHKMIDRASALKYPADEDYEVTSPFSNKCKGCTHQ